MTKRAHENPRFVENLMCDIAMRPNRDGRIAAYTLGAENFKPVYNHSVYVLIGCDRCSNR